MFFCVVAALLWQKCLKLKLALISILYMHVYALQVSHLMYEIILIWMTNHVLNFNDVILFSHWLVQNIYLNLCYVTIELLVVHNTCL